MFHGVVNEKDSQNKQYFKFDLISFYNGQPMVLVIVEDETLKIRHQKQIEQISRIASILSGKFIQLQKQCETLDRQLTNTAGQPSPLHKVSEDCVLSEEDKSVSELRRSDQKMPENHSEE